VHEVAEEQAEQPVGQASQLLAPELYCPCGHTQDA
jgi:hypothetical protein